MVLPMLVSLILVSVMGMVSYTACESGESSSVRLPTVSFASLNDDEVARSDLLSALANFGGVGILDIPNYSHVRSHTLQLWATRECSGEGMEQARRFDLPDGTTRRTVAALRKHHSEGGVIPPLFNDDSSSSSSDEQREHECEKISSPLRNIIEWSMPHIIKSLDESLHELHLSAPAMHARHHHTRNHTDQVFPTLSSIISNGESLEHFHTYSLHSDALTSMHTLPLHIDNGLFIAMTTGMFVNTKTQQRVAAPSEECGLYAQLGSDDNVKKVEMEDEALIVLMGSGARWLWRSSPSSPHSPIHASSLLRPLPHALIANGNDNDDTVRTWYGRMYFPPPSALLPSGQTFSEYRAATLQHLSQPSYAASSSSLILPAACEVSETPMNLYVASGQQCVVSSSNETGVYCWTQCVSTAKLPCGEDAVCWDTVKNVTVDGTKMCPDAPMATACQLKCLSEPVLEPLIQDQ